MSLRASCTAVSERSGDASVRAARQTTCRTARHTDRVPERSTSIIFLSILQCDRGLWSFLRLPCAGASSPCCKWVSARKFFYPLDSTFAKCRAFVRKTVPPSSFIRSSIAVVRSPLPATRTAYPPGTNAFATSAREPVRDFDS